MRLTAILLICIFHGTLLAQNTTLSGSLRDAKTGEELIGATIRINAVQAGVSTNVYGFYSLTVPKGSYDVTYAYIGYEPLSEKVDLNADVVKNVELQPANEQLNAVEVTGKKADANIRSTDMGLVRLEMKDVRTMPVLFGEVDVMKTIQLMPGVQQTGDGNTGFYVRGGGPDQNLILLDEAPIYNASHLLGFFSVFNGDAVKSVDLMKGAIPARYGGRLSSVLDVTMNDGNSKEMKVHGGIGLIASRLTVEGPIVKDKGSFIVSGRRTYADLFLKLSNNEGINSSKLYFYDVNVKGNYRLGKKDRFFLSGYFGRDALGYKDDFGFDWGNITGTLRWNHLFSNKLFVNTSFIASNYDYKFNVGFNDNDIALSSGIREYNLKSDFSYYANSKNTIRFGFNAMHHAFQPGKFTTSSARSNDLIIPEKFALEGAIYVSNEQKVSDRFSLDYGLRISGFNLMGPGEARTYAPGGELPLSTVDYTSGESIKTYWGPEPRLSASYVITEFSSVKAAYNRTRQYIHMLSNAGTGAPTDLWYPSTNNIEPQVGDQISLGYFRNLKMNTYETSVEVYYKDMQNLIDYKNGADILLNPNVESELLYGKGKAYGVEFFVKKTKGKLTGWIGYTLSRSERTMAELNNGNAYPNRYDRTHDASVVAMYQLNDKWKISAAWVYATGNAVTYPEGRYEYAGQVVSVYGERDTSRMPAYHRLDLSATLQAKKTEKFSSSWNFAVYNAYARQNPYLIGFRENEDNPGITEAYQVALFSIIPSVTYNFEF
ncbi:MAG: TonB-dependent receptor [Flavobacteriales bacterium]|nr:TonB-dependent receptor [Flavobacteriales bacterium]